MDIQANFGGDSEYGQSVYKVNYAEGIPQMQVPDSVLGERANEKPVETKLPIPSDLPPCKPVSPIQIHGDKFNEIEHRGNDFIYKANEKGKSKTFEYSRFYDCPTPPPPPPPPPQGEICGNGIDDDNDGLIDEKCPIPPPQAPGAPVIKSPTPEYKHLYLKLVVMQKQELQYKYLMVQSL